MPWILAAITWLATVIGVELTRKATISILAITIFAALTLALGTTLTTLLNAVSSYGSVRSGIDAEIAAGLGLFIPANAGPVVGAVLASLVARRVYDLNVASMKILASA